MIEDIKKFIFIIIPYTVLCSIIYLYFYWRNFGINPFDFISFFDASIYSIPMFLTSFSVILGVVISESILPFNFEIKKYDDKIVVKIFIWIICIVNFFILLYSEFIQMPEKLFLVGFYCGLSIISIQFSYTKHIKNFISNKIIRLCFCLILFSLPVYALMAVNINFSGIKEKSNYDYIKGEDIKGNLESENLIYLGKLNNFLFFIRENANKVVGYEITQLKKIEFNEFKKKHKEDKND